MRLIPDALKRSWNRGIIYTEGYFFVTMNVHDRLPILGHMLGRYDAQTKQVVGAGVCLTNLGEAVLRCWQQIPSFHPHVELLDVQIMPEHIHGLLKLSPPADEALSRKACHLGVIIKGFMVGCTHAYWDILGLPWREMAGRTDGVTDTAWTDWRHKTSLRGPSLFAPSYNDTVPFTPEEVATKLAYIRSNPERRIIKGTLRECFTIYRNQRSAHWNLDRVKHGLLSDYAMAHDSRALDERLQELCQRLLTNDGGQLCLSYVGRRELLSHNHLLPLVCHRIDAELFDQQKTAVLRAARDGAVIVSAFISPKERNIRDLLLQDGHPVVEILDNGMSGAYKPYGKFFYYCAESRLLQITCWTYLYQQSPSVTRPMCMVMNELARLISGSADDWWKNYDNKL